MLLTKYPEYFGRMADCVQLTNGTWISPKQVEEYTLSAGILNCQVQLREDGSACLVYDESGVKPTEQLYMQLKDLLSCDTVFGQPMPLEKMELRGLKPKYLVECGRETQAVAEHFL